MSIAVGVGVSPVFGSGPALTPESALAAIVAGYASPPDATRQGYMQTFIAALITAGIWAKLDVLYVHAATEDQGSRVNWKAPGSYNASKTGTPTFTTDNGWAGSSGNYLTSTFNASTAAGQFIRNNGHLLAATLTDANDTVSNFIAGISGYAGIQPRTSGGVYTTLSQSTAQDTGSANTGKGLYGWTRTTSATYDRYKNGALVDSPTRSSIALANAVLNVCTHNTTNVSSKVVSMVSIGGGLTAGQMADFNTAYAAYMTSIGVSPT